MTLSPIADYLQAKGCGEVGKSIFQYDMPATVHEGLLLLDNYYGTQIDHELDGYRATEFRLIARSKDMARGEALALKASDALTIKGDFEGIETILVKRCLPDNEPRVYKRSQGAYWEFEIDVDIRYVRLT